MASAAVLALKIYLLAAAIAMAVAVLIKIVERVSVAAGGLARPDSEVRQPTEPSPDPLEEDVPAIAAALQAILADHRIVHIEERERGQAWTAAGRSAHHGSHSVARTTKRDK